MSVTVLISYIMSLMAQAALGSVSAAQKLAAYATSTDFWTQYAYDKALIAYNAATAIVGR